MELTRQPTQPVVYEWIIKLTDEDRKNLLKVLSSVAKFWDGYPVLERIKAFLAK